MATSVQSRFQHAVDAVESLPDIQRQHLIEVVQRRMSEARREKLAKSIRDAKAEYRAGKVKKGSPTTLFKELRSCAE